MMLPPSLSTYNPTAATFEDGALEIVFAGSRLVTAEGSDPRAAEETLRRLEERLDRASAAAERLMAEAAHAAGNAADSVRGPQPPPAGWQAPEAEASPNRDSDLEALIALARSVRELIPPELQQRLVERAARGAPGAA